MKRILLTITLLTSLLMPLAVFGQAGAVDIFSNACSGGNTTAPCKDAKSAQGSKKNPVVDAIKVAIDILSFVVGAAAVIGIVVSGLRFILASGDSGSVASARSSLIMSLAGLAIVALAQTFVVFVLDNLNL